MRLSKKHLGDGNNDDVQDWNQWENMLQGGNFLNLELMMNGT